MVVLKTKKEFWSKKMNKDYVPGPCPVLHRLAMLRSGCRWAIASTAKEHWNPCNVS